MRIATHLTLFAGFCLGAFTMGAHAEIQNAIRPKSQQEQLIILLDKMKLPVTTPKRVIAMPKAKPDALREAGLR